MKARSWSPLASRPWPGSSPAASARRCSCSVTSLTGIVCDGTSSSVSASAHAVNVVNGAADDSDAPRRELHMLSHGLISQEQPVLRPEHAAGAGSRTDDGPGNVPSDRQPHRLPPVPAERVVSDHPAQSPSTSY